ncbi:MAG: branched-chain amino acid ABC transporter permease [Bdellovibrionaceae bacterium]|nr:branched-chain amino acid ABC transporter permease [Pseudobdellovibrionaceae bacterium]
MKALKIPLIAAVGIIAIASLLGLLTNPYIQLIILFLFINSIMGMSLNLVNGYTGQFSLGHAGFVAVGAYFTAIMTTKFPVPAGLLSIPYFVLISLGGGLVASMFGYIVGLPSLRLKGDYLAIVTLGFGEIIRVSLNNISYFGGALGVSSVPSLPEIDLGGFVISSFITSVAFGTFWALICFFVIWRLLKSSHGRCFLSVREDEIAAEAMGINTTKTKVQAFVVSSFFAGISGALFAHFTNYISPASFTFLMSIDAVIIVVLGGMGSMTGCITSAFIITLLPEILRSLKDYTGGIDFRMIIYSLALILIMILRPQGLFGDREITSLWRKKNVGSST